MYAWVKLISNSLVDWGSIHTKDSKMILDAALQNTQQYKVRIMGKVEQSREFSSAPLYTSM